MSMSIEEQPDEIMLLDIVTVLYKPIGEGVFHFLSCQKNPCHCQWVAKNELIFNGEAALQYYGAFNTTTLQRKRIIDSNDIIQQRELYDQIINEANTWLDKWQYHFKIEPGNDENFYEYLEVIKQLYNPNQHNQPIDR